MFLSVDIESRSTVDLRRTGVYPYALSPDTDIWCVAYALADGPINLWEPGMPVPPEFQQALDDALEFRAWNAAFERIMFRFILTPRYGFPKIPRDAWVDTAAEAAAMSLPRGLGHAAKVLGLDVEKDDPGRRLMLQMAKPRRKRKDEPPGTYWWDDRERRDRLGEYCKTDVEVERAISERLRPLSAYEQSIYRLDQLANDRGVKVDVPLVKALRRLADEAVERANTKLFELTGGRVEAVTNVQNIRTWLQSQGVELDDLTKQTVAETLAKDDIEEVVRDVLTTRADTGRTSTMKLNAMLKCLCPDERARGLLLYHGANTGRWSGRLIQPQNFPRPFEGVEEFIPLVMDNAYDAIEAQRPVMDVVSSMLRSCFIADEGCRFLCADFAAIEGHVTAWLAGEERMRSYEEMAAAIFRKPVESIEKGSFERQIGKVAVLGCGFGMGWKKYRDTVKAWTGLEINEETARQAVDGYRETNSRIKAYWYALERAALKAVQNPGMKVAAGPRRNVAYVVKGDFLWCILPSGRPLCYSTPRVVDRVTPWGETREAVVISGMNSMTRKWERRALYGGLLTENVVQAVARDLMAASMKRVSQAGYNVLLTVHDEVLAEAPNDFGSLEEFNTLMAVKPEWAGDCPLMVEGWEGDRYRK